MNLNFKVASDSMMPLIKIDGLLTVVKKTENYKIFDIIIFKRSSKLIVHYIWRNQVEFNQTIITRSLKNIYVDEEPVHKNEIIGVVENYRIGLISKIRIIIFCFIRRAL